MAIKICGNSVTFTSELDASEIMMLQKHAPSALTLKDAETKDELYAVRFNKAGGSINKFGITYDSVDADGKAYFTMELKGDNKREILMDKFGTSLNLAKATEDAAAAVALDLADSIETIKNSIEVL